MPFLILLLLVIAYQYSQLSQGIISHWNFPFELDLGDGDEWGFVYRAINSLPYYGDWTQGSVMSIYQPFYYHIVGAFDSAKDFGILVGRRINFVLVALLLGALAFTTLPGRSRINRVIAWALAASIFLSMNETVLASAKLLNPDTLTFFFVALTFCYANFSQIGNNSKKTSIQAFFLAALTAACCFSKQTAFYVPLTIVFYFALRLKAWRFLSFYLSFSLLLAGIITAVLEYRNQGNYLNSVVFGVLKSYPPGALSSWTHGIETFLGVLGTPSHVIAFSIASLFFLYRLARRQIDLLDLSFFTAWAAAVFLARNHASGSNYFSYALWITAALAARGILAVPFRNWSIVASIILLPLKPLSFEPIPEYRAISQKRIYDRIEDFHKRNPKEPFLSDRMSGPMVRLGLPSAFTGCHWVQVQKIGLIRDDATLQRVKNQHYGMIVSNEGFDQLPELTQAIQNSYTLSEPLTRDFAIPGFYLPKVWIAKRLAIGLRR